PVRAPLLRELWERMGAGRDAAQQRIRQLARLTHLADVRYSGLSHALAQYLLLWDFHVLERLERWQREAGPRAREWFEALGTVEALSLLAGLAHDNPEWAVPDVV